MKTEKKANRTLPQIQMKTKKKRSSTRKEHFFSLNFRSDVHPIQIIGGDADVDHSQTIRRDTAKLLGGFIPHPPPCFGTPAKNAKVFIAINVCLEYLKQTVNI